MIEPPTDKGYTIYSKNGCINCNKSADLLDAKLLPFKYINCDIYLIEDRIGFLAQMKIYAGGEVKMFPMVFFDGEYIGSYKCLCS